MGDRSRALLMQIALLLITTTTVAHCFLADNPFDDPAHHQILKIRILGRLECSVPPDRPPRNPLILGLTNVILNCTSRSSVLDAVSDINGLFTAALDTAKAVLFNPVANPEECRLVVRLPLARCAAYPPTGTLEAPLRLQGIVSNALLGGRVANYKAGEFHYCPPTDDHY
ncbi:Pollen Ole e 1 allergen and extensin family protein [Parasponia andersonii]|uniref:Pollen Ole e 1 allergen and extensin family protein n=1 Tax=Parasponia andersonii TaxID=3476 RepID=A0A2P5BCU3_PARAD|nr:Pollen Ole e 1 allergen and extensin family protein [Parasponia andersonii]